MEEDNDDFLGGVIEFGDGRQYKIQQTDAQRPSPPRDMHTLVDHVPAPGGLPSLTTSNGPVSKEDRFADDFDRSWPRSQNSPTLSRARAGPFHGISGSSTSSLSPQEPSRVLFNERSNKLEPYSNAHSRAGPPGISFPHSSFISDVMLRFVADIKSGKDVPPHHNIQLLQKTASERGFKTSAIEHDHTRDRHARRDSLDDRPWDRGRQLSTVSSSYAPSSGRELSKEGRQWPPHLVSAVPPRHSSGRDHEFSRDDAASSRAFHSPSVGRGAALPDMSPQSSTTPLVDVEEVRKAAMHSAAERAKLRRQQEEEDREKEKERARRKAAELEEKMKIAQRNEEHAQQQEAKVCCSYIKGSR